MKWLKHKTDAASKNEFIALIMDKYGLEGYARWFIMLETIAQTMDETDRCGVAYPVSKWCEKLRCKRKVLLSFLEHLENISETLSKQTGNKTEIKAELNGNILTIEIPNLLKMRDNHSRNLQVTSKRLASKEEEVEEDKEEEKKKGKKKATAQPIEYQKIFEAYNEILGKDLGVIETLSDERKKRIKARSMKYLPDIDSWIAYFQAVKRNKDDWLQTKCSQPFEHLIRNDTNVLKYREKDNKQGVKNGQQGGRLF